MSIIEISITPDDGRLQLDRQLPYIPGVNTAFESAKLPSIHSVLDRQAETGKFLIGTILEERGLAPSDVQELIESDDFYGKPLPALVAENLSEKPKDKNHLEVVSRGVALVALSLALKKFISSRSPKVLSGGPSTALHSFSRTYTSDEAPRMHQTAATTDSLAITALEIGFLSTGKVFDDRVIVSLLNTPASSPIRSGTHTAVRAGLYPSRHGFRHVLACLAVEAHSLAIIENRPLNFHEVESSSPLNSLKKTYQILNATSWLDTQGY